MTAAPLHLPLAAWPAADRAAWNELFRPGDVLDGRGAACHWSAATRRTNQKHYARWLGWLAGTGGLVAAGAPSRRATEDSVRAYARSLMQRTAPRTVASSVIGLKCVLRRMDPDRDWRWLMDLSSRLDRWALPSVERGDRILPAPQLFYGALAELDRLAACQPLAWRDRLAFRDTLIVALLAACPVRLRNLAQIRIGEHLVRVGAEWHLAFAATETKARAPLRYVLPAELGPWLELYLADVRPGFRVAAGCTGAWPGGKGKPLAHESLYQRVMATTLRLFGVAINPHSFRTCAATTLADHSPEDALFARPLLGHRLPQTTEHHYIRANQRAASARINAMLADVRGAPPRRSRP